MHELLDALDTLCSHKLPKDWPFENYYSILLLLDHVKQDSLTKFRTRLEHKCLDFYLSSSQRYELINSFFLNLKTLDHTSLKNLDRHKLKELIFRCPNLQKINFNGLSQEEIELLAAHCPHLKVLYSPISTFSFLPESLSESLTDLECPENRELIKICLPKAKNVNCSGCDALIAIELPEVNELDCSDCKSVRNIQADKVTLIDCAGCINLPSLILPQAITIYGNHCKSLAELYAPRAKLVECRRSILNILELPSAEKVDCSNSIRLKRANLPEPLEIHCGNCVELEALDLPKAQEVHCSACDSLSSVRLPKLMNLTRFTCPNLSRMQIPETATVYG